MSKKQYERKYVAKVNGKFFAGLSKDKVYSGSVAQFAFHNLVNICAKPDGMAAFEFADHIELEGKRGTAEKSTGTRFIVLRRTRRRMNNDTNNQRRTLSALRH